MPAYKEDVKKARAGDREAIEIVIMLAPRGATKGMTDEQYVEKLDTDEAFAEKVYGASGPMGAADFDDDEAPAPPKPSKLASMDPAKVCELHDAGVIEVKDPDELERLRAKAKGKGRDDAGGDDEEALKLLPDHDMDMKDYKGAED